MLQVIASAYLTQRKKEREEGFEIMIPVFASLLNEKRVVLSSRSNLVAVDRHLFVAVMVPTLSRIYVDESWYLDRFPDVQDALSKGIVKSAKDHYVRFGYYENRMPYQILVNENWYMEQYPDVGAAVRQEDFVSAQHHFEAIGFSEGRFPFPNFRFEADPECSVAPADPLEPLDAATLAAERR
jgi:hypothetical protein